MTEAVLPPKKSEPSSQSAEDFVVFYSLMGVTLVRAATAEQASTKATNELKSFIEQASRVGVGPTEAAHIRFGELEIKIDSAEAVIYQCQPPEPDEFSASEVVGLPSPDELSAARAGHRDIPAQASVGSNPTAAS